MLMGDYGADVIKVEPLSGDGARHWGPFLAGESRFFQGWNRSKRSIALDLNASEGKSVVRELVKRSDVVVENFRPGITKKLGIDYETLSAINPKLVYTSITAFGTRGPHGDRPGYDPVLQAMSGAAKGNVRYCGAVGICSVAVNDFGAAMLAYGSVAAALYHRERTGKGQKIETSLLQTSLAMQTHQYVAALDREEEPPFGIYPYRFFETQDDLIFIAAATDRFWKILCRSIGLPDLADDPKYARNADRVNHGEELTGLLQPVFKTKSTQDWEALLVEAGVPCGPAKTYQEFFEDPQVTAMDMNPVVNHPKIGRMRVSGIPVELSETPGAISAPPPVFGEHTDEVLRELNYTDRQIAALYEQSVIAGP